MPIQAAIAFEPDGYSLSRPGVMGRQSAGHAFLKAAVAASDPAQALCAWTPRQQSARFFAHMVEALRPGLPTRWIPAARLDLLSQQGLLYLPGPGLGEAARLRLRAGPAAYSLCGVTHTTASHRAMDAIKDLLSAPVMPWDALVCTSQAVKATVDTVLAHELDYLRWRLGPMQAPPMPQLPVVPLGVHADDFRFTAQERAEARASLGIAPDEVVALFVGRLSFHAKAHPHAMYLGLQEAARRTGRRITLLQCGWFANAAIERAFKDGAAQTCPDVRALFTDGQNEAIRRQSWAAADLFISLSDNIQETFGLTPIEAMAAGLPVVVTDWDGYRDTVRDGVDGFRIPTWMPAPGLGQHIALMHESGGDDYDRYCAVACQAVAVDVAVLCDRLEALVQDSALRLRLGQQAQMRARAVYDWTIVFAQYQALWADLADRRAAAFATPDAPRCDAARLDPFAAFASYPTHQLTPDTRLQWTSRFDQAALQAVLAGGLFGYMRERPHAQAAMQTLQQAWGVVSPSSALSVRELATQAAPAPTPLPMTELLTAAAMLMKIGALRAAP